MKKTKIFATVIICLLMCIFLSACETAKRINDDRFIKAEKYNDRYCILVDKYTGVKYLAQIQNGYSGISPLYDKNGNIEIMPEEELQELISNLQSSKQ